MTCLMIAIALVLPAALLVVVSHVKTLGGQWLADPGITVYLKGSLSESARLDVGARLQKLPGATSLEYISPQQGLEELTRHGGFGDALSVLEDNPLPPVYLLKSIDGREASLRLLSEQVRSFPEVEKVQLDLQWVQRLQHIITIAERAVILLGVLLSLSVLLTVGNTTRLILEGRRDEVAVIKMVGGTDAFVRRPLLYIGVWYGLAGGVLAWVLLVVASAWLAPALQKLLVSYDSGFTLPGPGPLALVQLLLVGGMLGLAGAWLASGRHLKAHQSI
jgi:cell division transport system permease protein